MARASKTGRKGSICAAPELRLTDSGSGDLSDVFVRCDGCGERRSMAQARGEKALPGGKGKRPWLAYGVGDDNVREECTEDQPSDTAHMTMALGGTYWMWGWRAGRSRCWFWGSGTGHSRGRLSRSKGL